MVSRASELLPEPLGPQHTVTLPREQMTVRFLRLCCWAPCTVRCVISPLRAEELARLSPRVATRGLCGRLSSTGFSACPVYDASHAATSSGVPVQTTRPPP